MVIVLIWDPQLNSHQFFLAAVCSVWFQLTLMAQFPYYPVRMSRGKVISAQG